MVNMAEYLFPLLQVHMKGNYGHLRFTKKQYEDKEKKHTLTDQERTEYWEPGPFSLVSYIEAFLARDFYGDEITLVLISMMWQMRITVVHAETLFQTKICHSNTIHLADIVVFRTRLSHYFPASKSLILSPFCFLFGCTMLVSTSAMLDISAPHWFMALNGFFFLFFPF